MEGHCTCGAVRFRLTDTPLFTHCCHCSWCQRETGSAFVLNATIEAHKVELLAGQPEEVVTPSASGQGQIILRCPSCRVALWSYYSGAGRKIAFVRVGTLAEPGAFPPDVHIFTSTKLPWVILPEGVPAFPEFYRRSELWPKASLDRRAALGL